LDLLTFNIEDIECLDRYGSVLHSLEKKNLLCFSEKNKQTNKKERVDLYLRIAR